ncbi:MAG: hypothetical protein WCH77_10615 [Planctomycetota bacterium]
MSHNTSLRKLTTTLAALAALVANMAGTTLHAHGGGGGHMGGMGGGGHMGGYGGPHMGGGGFDGGRSFDRDPDMGGGRGLDAGRPGASARPADAGRDLDGGRGLDGARGLDGGRSLDGAREYGGLDGAAGHFAGEHNLSKADFQRIADQGLGRDGLRDGIGRGAVRPYSINSLSNRGNIIRNNFYHGGWYGGRGWYGAHFGAWWPGAWWGGFGWGMGAGMLAGLAWSDLVGWGGYGAAPVSYNYGTNVCYQDDGVYVQGSRVGSPEEYAQQAATIAAQGGADVKIDTADQWRPLGVFALARSEETNPSTFLSLAIDKAGLLRGTYYDAVSDSTQNITGKVDKKTQRAAWTIGDKKTPIYEAGLSNLTQQQTTILVHRDDGKGGTGKVEQMLLVRVPDDKAAGSQAAPGAAAAPRPRSGLDADEVDRDEVDKNEVDKDEVDADVSDRTGSQ